MSACRIELSSPVPVEGGKSWVSGEGGGGGGRGLSRH